MIKKKYLLILSFIFILLHPFYLYILNTYGIYQMPLTFLAIIFAVLSCGFNIKISKKGLSYLIPWACLFMLMTIRNINYKELCIFYFMLLFLMLIYQFKKEWQSSFITLLHVLVFPNVIATIIIWIMPSSYSIIRPLIFVNDIMFAGYKTALTGHYSTNAIYISISLLISGCRFFCGNKKSDRKKYIVMFLVELIALILTSKRGPLLFSLSALFLTYLLVDKKRIYNRFIKLIAVIIFSFVIIYVFAEYIPGLNDMISRFVTDGTSGRDVMYALAFKMFLEDPIWGLGTGAYRVQYARYLATDTSHLYLNAHNVYLQLLCENGLIGLAIFLFNTIFLLYNSIRLLRKYFVKKEYAKEINMAVSVVFQIYFLLYCMTGNPLYDNMMYVPYFIFCASTYSYLINEKCKFKNKQSVHKN